MARNKNPVNDYLFYEKNVTENFKRDDLIPFLKSIGLIQFYEKEIDKDGIDSLDKKQKEFLDAVINAYSGGSGKEWFINNYFWANNDDVEKCKKIKNLYEEIFKIYGKENVFNPVYNSLYTLVGKVIKSSELFHLFMDVINNYTYHLYTSDYDKVSDFLSNSFKEVFSQFNNLYNKIKADNLIKIDKLINQEKPAELLYILCSNVLQEKGFFEEKQYSEIANAFNELLDPNKVKNKVNIAKMDNKRKELRKYEFSKIEPFMKDLIKNNNFSESTISEITDFKKYCDYYYIFLYYTQYYIAGEEIIPSSDISKITSSMQDIVIKFQNLK